MFVIDIHSDIEDECGYALDSGESYEEDESFDTCIEYITDGIDQLTQHYDWAYFGVVTTAESASDDTFQKVSALGTSHAQLSSDLDDLATDVLARGESSSVTTRNLAESIAALSTDYFSLSSEDTSDPWNDAPIDYHCQDTHTIVISTGIPTYDDNPSTYSSGSWGTKDVICDSGHNKGSTEAECYYDNVTHDLYNTDHRTLDGDQIVVNHTVGLRISGSSLTEELFGNASDQISNEGIYTVANQGDEVLGSLMEVLGYVRQGFFSRSAPVISSDGAYLMYAFYEITGDNPLAEGHLRAYEVDDDPESSTYGEILYDGDDAFGGAIWDAGDLLGSRPVISGETNPDDRDGLGQRDIYTFVPEIMKLSAAVYDVADEGETYHRMGFDAEFVTAANSSSTLLEKFIDTSDTDYNLDLDEDDIIDSNDLQALVDFTRGLPSAKYRFLDEEHGYWKLGDSPHSIPVVVNARNNNYTTDPTYRTFLSGLDGLDSNPDGVLIAANDGMLHFLRLEDDEGTTSYTSTLGSDEDADEAGEELWAWLPAYVLFNTKQDEDWAGRIVDMMWYGRTFLFDGTPVVEDVWIDGYGGNPEDGSKDCTAPASESDTFDPDTCEWRRVVVVQQGKGGPVTLALDITETQNPMFLWEQVNSIDYEANAYTVSRPVIANLYDVTDTTDPHDAWTAIWGSGRAVPQSTDEDYYQSAEANLYMRKMSDTYWEAIGFDYDAHTQAGDYANDGSNEHPESSVYTTGTLDTDSDGHYEYAYISGSVAAVDYDGDGDADVIYFPVTTSYTPTDEGGSGPGDVADPGHTWMYKAIIDTTAPDDPTWCEFVDPADYVGERPEVYYAPTASFHADGSLGIYWGTGTPYDRTATEDLGYLFAFKDTSPTSCTPGTAISCRSTGYYELAGGEGLTGDPLVYNGVVYFPTYTPDEDLCDDGIGRIYGLAYDDCDPAIDNDGDGEADADYIEVDGYPSNLTITEQGTLFYGVSNPDISKSGASAVGEVAAISDPFMGTKTLGLREIF